MGCRSDDSWEEEEHNGQEREVGRNSQVREVGHSNRERVEVRSSRQVEEGYHRLHTI